jgi:2-iminobutanoate/2-iminopropanoate deaminase
MRAINPPGPSIPGISQAMLVTGDKLLFLSGHVALGPDGVVGADLATQLDQVFKNLQATLQEAGADFTNVARLTIYVRNYDPKMLATIRSIQDRYVNRRVPLRALSSV